MSIDAERQFWDARVGDASLAALEREARFVEDERLWGWALERIAQAEPRRLLDVGCGRGFTTRMLARRHQLVVGADVSLRSLAAGRALAAKLARPPWLVGARLESLPFGDGSFDLVAGRFVLHHAESLEETARELHRVLQPGGRGVFVETWGKNPLLRFGRDVAELLQVGLGSPDERPLTDADVATLSRWFRVEVRFPVFTAFELANRLLRRGVQLAKRFRFMQRLLPKLWANAIHGDRLVERRLPWLTSFGWFVALELERKDR